MVWPGLCERTKKRPRRRAASFDCVLRLLARDSKKMGGTWPTDASAEQVVLFEHRAAQQCSRSTRGNRHHHHQHQQQQP